VYGFFFFKILNFTSITRPEQQSFQRIYRPFFSVIFPNEFRAFSLAQCYVIEYNRRFHPALPYRIAWSGKMPILLQGVI
jgi:hypothetical protein